MGWFNILTKVIMGNFSSYVKLPSGSKKGKLCIIYQEKVYINIVHDDYQIVTKHYLPKNGATRELAQKAVGLYLLNVEEMGNYEARKFVRSHFDIAE